MYFVWISEQTVTLPYTSLTVLGFITEVEIVYCAVWTESYITDTFHP